MLQKAAARDAMPCQPYPALSLSAYCHHSLPSLASFSMKAIHDSWDNAKLRNYCAAHHLSKKKKYTDIYPKLLKYVFPIVVYKGTFFQVFRFSAVACTRMSLERELSVSNF